MNLRDKLLEYEGRMITVKIEEDSTFIGGYAPTCTLVKVAVDFIEVADCSYGACHQFISIKSIITFNSAEEDKEQPSQDKGGSIILSILGLPVTIGIILKILGLW